MPGARRNADGALRGVPRRNQAALDGLGENTLVLHAPTVIADFE